jgi:hypothetical protein
MGPVTRAGTATAYTLDEMKEARKTTHKLSRLLEAALDTALVLVIGYALILLSQFHPL